MMNRQWDVIGLGVSTIDILTVVDDFPSEEGVVRAHDSAAQGGGPVSTAIVTLARLGARVRMIDRLGDDWRGDLILREYREAGVSTDLMVVDPHIKSSLATILVRKRDGKRSIVYAPGTPNELDESDVLSDSVASAKILHVNGRHWGACLKACQQARNHGTLVSFDGGSHRYRPELEELIKLTDICVVARDFAAKCTGIDMPEEAALKLKDAGPSVVVITDGARGAWIYPPESEGFHQPACLFHPVIDTTGCGDSYHGAFLFGLLRGLNLQDTARIASIVAGLNARKLGGRSGLPTLEELRSSIGDLGISLDL